VLRRAEGDSAAASRRDAKRRYHGCSKRGCRERVVGKVLDFQEAVPSELDALRKELYQTKAGQKVAKALRECYAEEKATLKPLRDEMRRDDITAAAKEAAEKDLLEKHSIFKKRFQACFYRAFDLRAPIGPAESPEGSLKRELTKVSDATCVAKAVVFGGYVS
jgi:predicted RNA binding protein with dsRBD fold (UPF0201 family)